MKLSLSFYQKVLWFTFAIFAGLIFSVITRQFQIIQILQLAIIPGCGLGFLLALTNLHRKEIVFTWKEKNTELHIPFGDMTKVIAYDTEGNKYKINILFIPNEIRV